MSRLAIALVLALAATAANAQDTKSEQSHTPAVDSAKGTRPFLFDGRMRGDGVRQGALNRCGNIDISMHVDREVAARQPWIQRVDSLDQVYGLRQVLCGGRAQKNSDRHKWAEKSHLERLEQAKVQEIPVLCGPI